jgi:hypothetical protein
VDERRQLVRFTCQAKVRGGDPLGVPFPGHRSPELVKLRLVFDAAHVHEAHLEGRRRLLEDRVETRFMTRRPPPALIRGSCAAAIVLKNELKLTPDMPIFSVFTSARLTSQSTQAFGHIRRPW